MLCIILSGAAFADDAERAKAIVASVCSACHGMDGNSTVPNFPKLAGRHPEYLVRELKEFVSGSRKSDIMTPIVSKLEPDDLKALGVYFGAQKPTSGQVLDEKAAAIGKKLYLDGDEEKGVPACAGCHDVDGSGNKRFPRLAGQHREYLIEQMHNFKNDVRNYAAARLMREVAKRLSDDEIKAVAEFLAGL
jgi:Cytochrome c553